MSELYTRDFKQKPEQFIFKLNKERQESQSRTQTINSKDGKHVIVIGGLPDSDKFGIVLYTKAGDKLTRLTVIVEV